MFTGQSHLTDELAEVLSHVMLKSVSISTDCMSAQTFYLKWSLSKMSLYLLKSSKTKLHLCSLMNDKLHSLMQLHNKLCLTT